VHAIHLTVGIGIVSVATTLLYSKRLPLSGSTIEGNALYWHLVDIIWIILLPLIYLIGRAS
jgi:cytochrome c oxidase subunit 3